MTIPSWCDCCRLRFRGLDRFRLTWASLLRPIGLSGGQRARGPACCADNNDKGNGAGVLPHEKARATGC